MYCPMVIIEHPKCNSNDYCLKLVVTFAIVVQSFEPCMYFTKAEPLRIDQQERVDQPGPSPTGCPFLNG